MVSAGTINTKPMLKSGTFLWPGQDISKDGKNAPSKVDSVSSMPTDVDLSSEETPSGFSSELMSPQRCFEASVYELLLASSAAGAEAGILFAWWPRSKAWNYAQLAERSTRCLPAVRPCLDCVALPDIPEVREIWGSWSSLHGLSCNQAIWFPPLLEKSASEDPALATCKLVLKSISAKQDRAGPICVYPMYMTEAVQVEAAFYGLHVIGDPENHELMPLSSAKAWMHPHIAAGEGLSTSSLREALKPELRGARGPYGYVASTLEELRAAWVRLQKECPAGIRLVLKPSSGSGGCGVVLDAADADFKKFDFSSGTTAILEEMVVGAKVPQSPTLYMIGDMPCGCLSDQVLSADGTVNLGNKYPSNLRADLLTVCVSAAQEVNKVWKLTGNWGLDFVLDSQGIPIIVDLNMGRPNGNLAVRCWASLCPQRLSVHTSSWFIPANGPDIQDLTTALGSKQLLWNGFEGVIVYQHFVDCECSYAVASSNGDSGMQKLLANLAELMLKRFGIKMNA